MFDKTTFSIRRWCWERFGALAGALWEILGMYWGLSAAPKSTLESFQIHLGTLVALVCSLLAAKDGFGNVLSSFGTSRIGLWTPKLPPDFQK